LLKYVFRTVSCRRFAIFPPTHFLRALKRPGGAGPSTKLLLAKTGVFPGRPRAQAKADPAVAGFWGKKEGLKIIFEFLIFSVVKSIFRRL
jgi:hypothetical protein